MPVLSGPRWRLGRRGSSNAQEHRSNALAASLQAHPSLARSQAALGQQGRSRLTSTLVEAMAHTEVARWLFPREHSRTAGLRLLVSSTIEQAERGGVVVADEAARGASVWLREDGAVIRHPGRYVERLRVLAAAGGADPRPLLRGRRYDQAAEGMLAPARQALGEHWRLTLLAVGPLERGSDLGSALLRRSLQTADGAGVSTLLIAHHLREVDFFGRFGYRLLDDAPVAGGGLHLWLLSRPNPLLR